MFRVSLEPVPYKALEGDPMADLPLSQQSLLDEALASALKHEEVNVKGELGKKGYAKLSEIVKTHQVEEL
jgi:RNA:NAD 2'-phosphotransferase (TPT1/KptA family)